MRSPVALREKDAYFGVVLVELLVLLELELELRAPLGLWPLLLLLERLAPELLPELPLELCELLAPELEEGLDEGLLRPELPLPPELALPPELLLPPLELELGLPLELEPELEEPELCMKFSRGASRRGSWGLPPPEEGEGSAAGELAPEPAPLLPLPPELALPLEAEPEPELEESVKMLGGNGRRESGALPRPEEGEGSSGVEVAPEPPLPPETAGAPALPGPELVMTPPDRPPAPRRSRALRIAS